MRRWWIVVGVILAALALGEMWVSMSLKRRLVAMAGAKGAQLEIVSLLYVPPFAMRVGGARLLRGGHRLNADIVWLRLTEFPRQGRPLHIEQLDIARPTLHLARGEAVSIDLPDIPAKDAPKMSDLLRLRRVRVHEGQVVLDARDDGRPAMTWGNIDVNVDGEPRSPAVYGFDLAVDNAPLVALRCAGTFDVDALQFEAHGRLQSAQFPQPLTDFHGRVRVANGEAIFEDLGANYGADRWMLRAARMPLKTLPEHLMVNDLSGWIDFQQPGPIYPRSLAKTVAALNPVGRVFIDGAFTMDRTTNPPSRDWSLRISTDQCAFAMTAQRVALTDIRGQALLANRRLELQSFSARSLNGEVLASGSFSLIKPVTYAGEVRLNEVDLAALSRAFLVPEAGHATWSGRGSARATLSGRLGPANEALAALVAEGEGSAVDGAFFHMPVLRDVVTHMGLPEASAVAGEAAAIFSIADGVLTLRSAAVSAPVLGLQGGGTIGLSGKMPLELRIVAAPLADWRERLKGTKIPLLSAVAGELAGAVQHLLNAATSTLLYEFRVTGNTSEPHLQTVPTPILSDSGARLFGHMLGERKKDERLLDWIGEHERPMKKN